MTCIVISLQFEDHSSHFLIVVIFAYSRWGDCQTKTIYSNTHDNPRAWFRHTQVSVPSQSLIELCGFAHWWIIHRQLSNTARILLVCFDLFVFLLSHIKRENTTAFFGPPFETNFEAHNSEGKSFHYGKLHLYS